MHIETETLKVVQLLLKGENYEELCPNDEDTWYNFEEVTENDLLKRLLVQVLYTDCKQAISIM